MVVTLYFPLLLEKESALICDPFFFLIPKHNYRY